MKIKTIFKLFAFFALIGTDSAKKTKHKDSCDALEASFNPCKDFGFEVVAGHPSETNTRWIIGELHDYREDSTKCIKALGKKLNGDKTYFVEGCSQGPQDAKLCHLLHDIQITEQGSFCAGWDDVDARNELLKENPRLRLLHYILSHKYMHQRTKLRDEDWDARYTAVTQGRFYFESKNNPAFDPAYAKSVAKQLLDDRKTGYSYEQIFNLKKYNEAKTKVKGSFYDIDKKRDVSLVQSLRAHPLDRKAILIAGRDHVKARGYVARELEKDKQEKQIDYVILGYKN